MTEDKSKRKDDRLAELEAKAVAEATASADDSFKPAPSLLNASSPEALLQQVDGPTLEGYNGKESVYVGKSVPVALRSKLEVPINVSAPGSVVEYAIESKSYDIGFGVTAEREEGITVVKVRAFSSHVERLGMNREQENTQDERKEQTINFGMGGDDSCSRRREKGGSQDHGVHCFCSLCLGLDRYCTIALVGVKGC